MNLKDGLKTRTYNQNDSFLNSMEDESPEL